MSGINHPSFPNSFQFATHSRSADLVVNNTVADIPFFNPSMAASAHCTVVNEFRGARY